MCDRYEYEHLMLEETMAKQAKETEMTYDESMDDRGTSPLTNFGIQFPSDSGDNPYEDSYEAHQESVTAFVSPFVKRNLDCAQYPQPRGSQYEG